MSYLNPGNWHDTHKKTFSAVASAGLGAVLVSPTVVYLAGDMKWLNTVIAKHIVEPHLKQFEKLFSRLEAAHAEYDKEKYEQHLSLGESAKEKAPLTSEERAYKISNILLKSSIALGADFISSFGFQHVLDYLLKIKSHPAKTVFADATVTLLGIALMPTIFAGPSEHVRHSFIRKNILENMLGMDKKRAEDVSGTLTYVAFPSLVGTLASLGAAHSK